jgi:hypothetical protein
MGCEQECTNTNFQTSTKGAQTEIFEPELHYKYDFATSNKT